MKRGASLVEVILTVSLAGLVILFLLGLLPSTGLLSRQAEHQVQAGHYAGEILAKLESKSFQSLKRSAGTLTPDSPGLLGAELEARRLDDSTVLQPEVTIASIPPTDYLVQVSVLIRWNVGEHRRDYRLVKRVSSVAR
jgi:hypothetical protein